ncbi:hypothetical protein QYS49_24535 [Marivirga salinae]|uniref:Uncharacterized protein n=1 Tax=Marivirga salinarum TaxID=3059078 RepID=A0AA49GD95_9BACT|nr:hypothetical protein [Marivirga sp. BDSF4-3]WKK74815.1 hypothetical protein QYS49_24535 [Marivirga sp. BDSF4-3]
MVFTTSAEKYLLHFKEESQINIQKSFQNNFISISNEYAIVTVDDNQSIARKIQSLKNSNTQSNLSQEPVLVYKDGIEQIFIQEMMIKLNGTTTLEKLLKNFEYSSTENDFVKGQYLVKFKSLTTREWIDPFKFTKNEWNE